MIPLHVLLLPSWYPSAHNPINGIFIREQAKALRAAGVQVGVIAADVRYWRSLTLSGLLEGWRLAGLRDEDGLATYRLRRWHMARFETDFVVNALLTGARRYIRQRGRPDLIHVHTTNPAGLAAQLLLHRRGIPFIITEHDSSYYQNRYAPQQLARFKPVFAQARRVLVVSRAAGRVLMDKGLVQADQLTVVPNSVDTDFFTPLPRSASPFRFLTVSMLAAIKRVDWLLRAFALAFPADESVVLEIGGDGKDRPALEQLARDLHIADRVRFLGLLDREGVRAALRNANAFVLSSRFETFSVVLIEALASGLPLVATQCGGPEDIVTPEVGTLVPVDDVDAYASALREMRATAGRYDPAALHRYAVERYSAPKVSADLIALYQSILASGRTG